MGGTLAFEGTKKHANHSDVKLIDFRVEEIEL